MFNGEKFTIEITKEQHMILQINRVVTLMEQKLGANTVQNEEGNIEFRTDDNDRVLVATVGMIVHFLENTDDVEYVAEEITKMITSVNEQVESLMNFEEVKDNIILIPWVKDMDEGNTVECSLTGIPLEEIGLKALFAVDSEYLTSYITESVFAGWNVTEEELYELAIQNMIRKLPFKEKRELNVRTGTLDKYMVPDVEGYDMSIKSSGIFILEALGLLNEEGTLVLMPSRNAFIVSKLDKHYIKIMSKYNEYVYETSTRYTVLEHPLYYKDGKWGIVKKYKLIA